MKIDEIREKWNLVKMDVFEKKKHSEYLMY